MKGLLLVEDVLSLGRWFILFLFNFLLCDGLKEALKIKKTVATAIKPVATVFY